MKSVGQNQLFSVADFAERAQNFVAADNDEAGDYANNDGIAPLIRANATKDAAVLIGMQADADGMAQMLLTQRTAALRAHAGQVAFPGGRIDKEDVSIQAAALRECEEETGIAPQHVEIVGQLPVYLSGSGYRIHPVLAIIAPNVHMRANPDEVDAIFSVPLSLAMDPSRHQINSRPWQGVERFYFTLDYSDYHIWGVTAGIIRQLYERLYR